MKVLLVTGGNSSEREISLNSANYVKQVLEENGHKVLLYDLRDGYDPILELSKDYDVLFPVLHGEEGEGGKLHKFLSLANKPIVGTRNYKALERAWYKISFKKFCDRQGTKTSPWKLVKNKQDILDFGFPCVLKASNGGSSREVVMIRSDNDLKSDSVETLILRGKELYVEKLLTGTEVTVGILNDKALPVIEIVPPEGSWFNYENKYSPGTKEIPFAPSVDPKLQSEIQKTTLNIHRALDLGTYSRTDFIILEGKAYALEINTIPGLTPESLMPKMVKAAGMTFNDFLEILLKYAS